MYDVIIVGAGPAGLFAAHELSKKRLKVLVIDKGKDISKRKDVLTGVGGAGLFSDGKLNLTPVHGKTNLLEFLKRSDADHLINYIDKVLMRFGATKQFYPKDVKKVKQLQNRAKKHGIGLLNVKHKHLGSDKLKKIMKRFVDNLKDFGVKFLLSKEVDEFIVKRKKCHGVILKNGKKLESKYVIACPGRVGSKWITEQMKKLNTNIKHRGIEIGVRVEAPSKVMKHVTDHIWDPVFFIKTDRYKDYVRTFCCCPGGYVAQETYHGFIGVNGYCRKDRKSKNTNFALLVNVKLTHPAEDTIAYGESIASVATTIAGGKPFIQRLDDLKLERRSYWDRINKSRVKPTLRKATPGDLSMAIPHRITINLIDALKQLDKIMPGLYKDILIYGPELKFFSVRVNTNKKLETEIKNLFVAGDGVGVCGNIIGAAATGCIAARGVLKGKKL